jgi:hypothetical protein
MATILQAWQAYGTKLKLNPTVQLSELAEWMSSRTGLNKSEILMVLQELHEGILYFNKQGTPVKLPGIGTFSPSVDRTGTYKINFRADSELRKAINNASAYRGRVDHKGNQHLTNVELKALWDKDHPDDPLEI